MKGIEEQTHYEILEVSPTATTKEIQRAYERIKEIFHSDSMAIYSLFSDQDIKEIQDAIEEAYRVLIDESLRRSYNQSHLQMPGEQKLEKPPKAYGISQKKEASLSLIGLSVNTEEVIYRGKTLKQIRERMNIDLKAISAETKISPKVLEWIEEETLEKLPPLVYLKGFLKGYARYLNLDPQKVIDGYLHLLNESKKK